MGACIAKRRSLTPQQPTETVEAPRPPVWHVTIKKADVTGKKLLIVGDVHGCLDELQELLRKSGATEQDTVIIFVGDVINKGPKNLETLRFLRNNLHGAYFVRGNHEEKIMREWFRLKSGQAIKDKDMWIADISEDDINFIRNFPYTISIPSVNILVVHAGLVPGRALREQTPRNMISMRNVVTTENGEFEGSSTWDNGLPWAQCWQGPEHVYFGHDAGRQLQECTHATGLDTGCVYGLKLTAVLLDEGRRRFIEVQAK